MNLKSDLGRYDWWTAKVDSTGKPVTDSAGKAVSVFDGYDQQDYLEHERARADDYVLACRAIASILDDAASEHAGDQAGAAGDDYMPADWFTRQTKVKAPRLRQAARPKRKTRRVKTTMIDGVKRYSVSDARQNWPDDMNSKA